MVWVLKIALAGFPMIYHRQVHSRLGMVACWGDTRAGTVS